MAELAHIKQQLMGSEKQQIYDANIIKENEERIKDLEIQNTELLNENRKLKEKINAPLNDQQSRVELIVEIARCERSNLYDDIIDLIGNQERFSLDNLLAYSASEWLSKRNPIVVKFIQTLTYNENENQLKEGKLFKNAVAVDAIYGARHTKYVSAVNLATSAIKYSLSKSKTIINIDNHILNSGSFYKFLKWQECLAGEPEPLPEGLLFMAFDNEQKGQKNYLDRGNNTVICCI